MDSISQPKDTDYVPVEVVVMLITDVQHNPNTHTHGMFCRAWPNHDHDEFELWTKDNCPSAQMELKFNSGNPYYSVWIPDSQESAWFLLKWNS